MNFQRFSGDSHWFEIGKLSTEDLPETAEAANWCFHQSRCLSNDLRRRCRTYFQKVPRNTTLSVPSFLFVTIFWNTKDCEITHYSKSQIFVQKFNFDQSPTFSRVFHPNLTIFLVKSKLSIAKKSKTTTFSRVFHPKK